MYNQPQQIQSLTGKALWVGTASDEVPQLVTMPISGNYENQED